MPTLSFKCHHSWKKNTLSRLQILLHGVTSPGAELPPAPPSCGPSGRDGSKWISPCSGLGEGQAAPFKFSTRNLSEPPHPLPFCGCLMHLATLNRYLQRGEGCSPARRGEGRMGPAPAGSCFPLPSVNPRLSAISTYSVRVTKPFPQALYSREEKFGLILAQSGCRFVCV